MSFTRRHVSSGGSGAGIIPETKETRLAAELAAYSQNSQQSFPTEATKWWTGIKDKLSMFVQTSRAAIMNRGFAAAGPVPAQ